MFVDRARIMLKAGYGGNGCSSFRRETFVPKGGPDGGDGGKGGDIILKTDAGEQSLVDLVYNRHFQAGRGVHGKGKDMIGKRGDDVTIRIPVGTIITNAVTGEFIIDMEKPDMTFIIAKGGKGGRGNARFTTSTNRAPREHEPGQPGEEKEVILELKTIADVGLVGYPNAGKSTLLRAISHAKPKVAAYPFTTLHPVVGIVEFEDYHRLTVADIPGLIDGAHMNIGLGHDFLKHIERTKVLAYVLDTSGMEGRDPIKDFYSLQNELELYMKGLSKRRAIIVANKMDLEESKENFELIKEEFSHKYRVYPISAEFDKDLGKLKKALREILKKENEKVPRKKAVSDDEWDLA